MANKKYEEANVQAIADAIRDKTGGTEALTLDGMASGVNDVYEAGKTKERSDFWDSFQNNGARTDYKYAFAYAWTPNCFYPKYDIKPTGSNGQQLFGQNHKFETMDLEKRLEECGVVLDLSKLTSSDREFYLSRFKKLPILDYSGCTTMTNTFDYLNCSSIRIKLSESGETTFTNVMRRAHNLKSFEVISGVIGKTISFADSSLNVASMKNIIEHLKNYTGTDSEFVYTVTFSSDCKTVLEAEGVTSPNGNLWSEYIDDLGWNLK